MSTKDHLSYVRLRSPVENKATLDVPQGDELDRLFSDNVALKAGYPESLSVSAAVARINVFGAAVEYTRRYLPEVDDWLAEVSSDRILIAGHQPALFHPGVWYKNFRLSSLSKQHDAVGINLVVDNDLFASPTIGWPQFDQDGDVRLELLHYDQDDATVPHEQRPILDADKFEGFAEMAAAKISSVVDSPIIAELWPEVLAAKEILGDESLGRVLAAGRHRLEWRSGLRTLEVPISVVAGTLAFGSFAGRVLFEIEKFQTIYNSVLLRYRDQHGIRSTSHPVPELARVDDWWETPFWIWTPQDPQRRRLFVKSDDDNFQLTDLNQFEATIGIGHFPEWWSEEVKAQRICVRPRALATTMFHRLFASDLFIHGIGGAKYDQLTDQIIEEFYGVSPPGYVTSTATFTLPFDVDKVTRSEIAEQQQLLRSLRYHPEKHVKATAANEALALKKREAIQSLHDCRQPSVQQRGDHSTVAKAAHDQIEAINAELFQQLAKQSQEVQTKIESLHSRLHESQLLYSREYSFALHPMSIIEDLKSLSQQ